MLTPLKKSPTFKTVNTSDWHLGHPNTPTMHILTNLRRDILNPELLKQVDAMFFGGDMFHDDLGLHQTEVANITLFAEDVVKASAEYNLPVRILEGTPRHDWKQSRLFIDVNRAMGGIGDIMFITDVFIEKNEKLGLSILYIPDEYRETCAETKAIVEMKMMEAGLEQVDIVIMHGCFEYQFPRNLPKIPDCHDIDYYCGIAKHYISIGHVHTHSRFKKAFAQGSYDRTSHGEEEPKGYVVFEGNRDFPNKGRPRFVENACAMRYDTVDVTDMDTVSGNLAIINKANVMPLDSFIRIKSTGDSPLLSNVDEYRRLFPRLNWKTKKDVVESMVYEIKEYSKSQKHDRVSITKDNIAELVAARTMHLDLHVRADVLELLEKLKNV